MTRGNQRDLAREKNQKKLQEQAKKKAVADGGMSLEQRKARDAEIMRLKQEKKLEEAAAKAAPPPKK